MLSIPILLCTDLIKLNILLSNISLSIYTESNDKHSNIAMYRFGQIKHFNIKYFFIHQFRI